MVVHCDKCGTGLDSSQARHQRYEVAHPSNSVSSIEGSLCSDCVWDLEEWLETR